MRLSDKQAIFTDGISKLVLWANEHTGVRLRFREVGRYAWVAQTMHFFKRGIVNSTHCHFLAADMVLDLMVDGAWSYQTGSAAYGFLGDHWKTLHEDFRWGGDFHPRPDGNHFSMEHNGVK